MNPVIQWFERIKIFSSKRKTLIKEKEKALKEIEKNRAQLQLLSKRIDFYNAAMDGENGWFERVCKEYLDGGGEDTPKKKEKENGSVLLHAPHNYSCESL